MSDTPGTDHPRCIHVCCKSMLVFGEDFESDPEYTPGLTDFWCTRTSKGQGPDGGAVSLELCNNPERSCYQEY
jgi:hypothetical protein